MKTKTYTISAFNTCCHSKTHRILFIFVLLSILFIIGCSQDKTPCNKHTEYTSLSDDYKNKVPYTGSDTLIFISNTNDTIKCVGTGKTTSQDCVDNGGSPECPLFTSTMCYENLIWNFTNQNSKLSIKEEMSQIKYFSDKLGYNRSYTFKVTINNQNFYLSTSCISDYRCVNDYQHFFSSYLSNGKQYINVTTALRDVIDSSSKIYLNNLVGVFRIELNNQQQIWTLK